ncbi:hypothetical protein EDD22DRAFT_1003872 [Suillus occidentalis]|nr:hypothetical protein EDD22DRAFT_1003872 [Suillus occidentalis]
MKSNGTYSVVSPEDLIIKRVGMSLQLMLKHEYGDVYDGALKVELKEYWKGADPFNHKIHKYEKVRDWWLAVQKDENALAIKLYSVVPVSMADKRTVSTITWLHSPTWSRQDISTLKEHIQIHQWHHWQVDPIAPTVTPSVKWRDMYATIHVNEHQGRCSDSDDEDGDWPDNGDSADHVGLAGVKSTEFNMGKDTGINISSTYLLNILSDHPVQPTAACGGLSMPKVMARTLSSTLMDDKWEEWR